MGAGKRKKKKPELFWTEKCDQAIADVKNHLTYEYMWNELKSRDIERAGDKLTAASRKAGAFMACEKAQKSSEKASNLKTQIEERARFVNSLKYSFPEYVLQTMAAEDKIALKGMPVTLLSRIILECVNAMVDSLTYQNIAEVFPALKSFMTKKADDAFTLAMCELEVARGKHSRAINSNYTLRRTGLGQSAGGPRGPAAGMPLPAATPAPGGGGPAAREQG